jgi:uncharacterized heparinase superfamily protein
MKTAASTRLLEPGNNVSDKARQKAGPPTLLEAARAFALNIMRPSPRQSMRFFTPDRLRIAPPDIRTADSTVADEICAGYFTFAGKTLVARGQSPFQLPPPSDEWRRSLVGFSWLRHLRAATKPLASEQARTLVANFLALRKVAAPDPGADLAVTARRVISFLAQSPLILEGAEQSFYETFLSALASSAWTLSRALSSGAAVGADRLLCAIAVTEFCVCADAGPGTLPRATLALARELERQILEDGGHIGRNPQAIVDLLLDLLPLRQIYGARGVHTPEALQRSIERMIPMLRLLQHGDGSLALFNGMGATRQDQLATIFAHDSAGQLPADDAAASGYRRLAAGGALVILDAGTPPPQEFSGHAGAGALSFDYSLDGERIIVNCGAAFGQRFNDESRATAAHSTLSVNNKSSCRFARVELHKGKSGGPIIDGPAVLRAERRRAKLGDVLDLSHDGYAKEFGLLHKRVLALTHDGARLIGEDRLIVAPNVRAAPSATFFTVRFHVPPRVRLAQFSGDHTIEIITPSGAVVVFESRGLAPTVEESTFFASPEGPRKTMQIVLRGPASADTRLRWSFRRMVAEE